MTDDGRRKTEDGGRRTEDSRQWADVVVPKDAIVFGRHGGDDSFDIPWVQKAVVETAKERSDIWFLFLNTRSFHGAEDVPNIRFLPATADPIAKRQFLNTCNAMLHGRMRGETFGLSCLEFAMLGKPVLTFANSPEKAHLEILGDSAVAYRSASELRELFRHPLSVIRPRVESGGQRAEDGGRMSEVSGPKPVVGGCGLGLEAHRQPTTDHRQPTKTETLAKSQLRNYQPEAVMKKFQEVFLK